ncbi:uncharacterized protein LOC129599021 isoform X2 [Paramacrobiotus metropolitanus]|nr:uncharacterized protein LOC129599021 isoform X2 [Paramacrobiotus metropolitanus]
MRRIEDATSGCVSFVKRTVQEDFVLFQHGDNCSSFLGMKQHSGGAGQPLYLGNDLNASCMVTGIVQHEILHALGMYHEHSRPDRDAYIDINPDAIMPGREANFNIKPKARTYGIEYDLESIMHYGAFDFAVSHRIPVIERRVADAQMVMGQRKRLAVRDAAKLRVAYNCQVDTGKYLTSDQLVPRFDQTFLAPEECDVQFNEHCGLTTLDRRHCRTAKALIIACTMHADENILWNMTSAMAKYPLREVGIILVESQITPEPFRPIRDQVTTLIMLVCSVSQATARIPSLGFSNLKEFGMIECRGVNVRKQDFAYSRKLSVITFTNTTLTYLEKGTFTNLEHLELLAWHLRVHQSPVFTAEMQDFLRYMHCSCELGWFRQWWKASKLIKNPSNSSKNRVPFLNTDLQISEIFLPIDCAAQPFPSHLNMIDFTQRNFSINAPISCQQNRSKERPGEPALLFPPENPVNMTLTECLTQFNTKCRPSGSGKLLSPTDYCFRAGNRGFLDITCQAGITSRELQDMTYDMAKLSSRDLTVSLVDGDYISYSTFAVIRTRVYYLDVRNCVDRRAIGKLTGLEFTNLVYFAVANCYRLVIKKNDFAGMPNLDMIFLFKSTLSSLDPGSFSYLPRLSVLSLEAGLRDDANWSNATRQYLWELHCSCQYDWFRSWWASKLIPKLKYVSPNEPVLTQTENVQECHFFLGSPSVHGYYLLERPVHSILPKAGLLHNALVCFGKQDLYIPVDCGDKLFPNNTDYIDFGLMNFSANAPDCMDNYTTGKSVLPKMINKLANMTELRLNNVHNGEATSVHKTTVKERRSQILTIAINPHGNMHFQDDQWLNTTEPASRTGELSKQRFWPDRTVPFLISKAFDWRDVMLIESALDDIHLRTARCLNFVKKTSEVDFIYFLPSNTNSGCRSPVGRQGGAQMISLTPACLSTGIIQHLVLHSLGLFHEHQRPDRDNYVNFDASRTNLTSPFQILSKMPSYSTAYDLESIMHFGPYDFANGYQPVLLPKYRSNVKMGQRRGLSATDVVKLNTAYNCTIGREKTHMEPFPAFLPPTLSPLECARFKRFPCISVSFKCTGTTYIRLECEKNPSLDQLRQLTAEVSKSLQAVTLLWYDAVSVDAEIFQPIRRQVISFTISNCASHGSTRALVQFRFNNLLVLTLSHCYDLSIRRRDFLGLGRLTTVLFYRSTIQALEWDAFAGLPELRVLSMELCIHCNKNDWSKQREKLGLRYLQFIEDLHCGCRFSKFRSWIDSNKALIAGTKPGYVFHIENIMRSAGYKAKYLYVPADCSKVPFFDNPDFFNFSRTEYSINEQVCNENASIFVTAV